MKRMLVGLVVLFVLVALAPPTNAQICPPWVDQVACLQQDAYNIIHGARRRQAINLAIADVERGIFRAGRYGVYNGGVGGGGGRITRDIGVGLAGAAIGGLIGGRRGALIGGGAGVGAAELGGYYANRRNRPLDCEKRKLSRNERETCATIVAEQEAQQARAETETRAQVERGERNRRGGFHKNLTPFPLRVSCGEVDEVINPGRRVFLPEPTCNGGYTVQVLEPSGDMPGVREDRELGDGRFRSAISEDGRGWVYYYDSPRSRQGGVR